MKSIERKITEIANKDIFYDTGQRENLNRKHNIEWDHIDVPIWDLKKALMDAYQLGFNDANKEN